MGEATGIQWCHHTWSPWRGCTKVSEGCKFCYAEKLSHRNPAVLGEWGPHGLRAINRDWDKPVRWDRAAAKAGERRRVFPSLCDPFEERPDLDSRLARFLALVYGTPALDWLILTKRPGSFRPRLRRAIDSRALRVAGRRTAIEWSVVDWLHAGEPSGRPHPTNVWLGTSVENQQLADERIPALLEIPAAVRWLSVEPLLGPIDLSAYLESAFVADADPYGPGTAVPAIDWVVVGGESGPHARPCDIGWVRSVVAQCEAAGVPVFVKQLGARPYMEGSGGERFDWPCGYDVPLTHPKGGDPAEWPAGLRVREFPRGVVA